MTLGHLYGLGLGPGDPELVTLKALRLLRAAPVVAYPAPDIGDSFARAIVAEWLNPGQREIAIRFPMRPGPPPATVYDEAAVRLAAVSDRGEDIAFLCQGDPLFYGSFAGILRRLVPRYRVTIVPGVSSLTACAAAIGLPLAQRDDTLTVIPATLAEDELARRLTASEAAAVIKIGRHFAELFAAGRPIIGLCASGILIRAIGPSLDDKRAEPPVVALAEDGSVAVPLLGGHHGANALARALAAALGGTAAITTAGDLRLGLALDEPPPGWRIRDPERVKSAVAALLAGRPVSLIEEACRADWLRTGAVEWTADGDLHIVVTDRAAVTENGLIYHPPVLALGIGCERGCPADEIAQLAQDCLAEAGLAVGAVAAVVSVD